MGRSPHRTQLRRHLGEFAPGHLGIHELPPRVGHLAHDVDHAAESHRFFREGLEQACTVVVPACRHAEGKIRKDEGSESVRVERPEPDSLGQAHAAQDAGDRPLGSALADIVQADVELVGPPLVASPKHLRVAAGDVVRLQDEGAPAGRRQVCRACEATQARPDDDRVPLFGVHHLLLSRRLPGRLCPARHGLMDRRRHSCRPPAPQGGQDLLEHVAQIAGGIHGAVRLVGGRRDRVPHAGEDTWTSARPRDPRCGRPVAGGSSPRRLRTRGREAVGRAGRPRLPAHPGPRAG